VFSPGAISDFARPKSKILTRPSFVMKMLSGFKSRCTIPFFMRSAESIGYLDAIVHSFAEDQRPTVEPFSQSFALE